MSLTSQRYNLVEPMTMDYRCLGLEALMAPLVQQSSSPRAGMHASQLRQYMLLDGCEVPKVFTGWEAKIGKYQFEKVETKEDIEILKVIKRYVDNVGTNPIKSTPAILIIYRGLETGEVGYYELKTHTTGSDGFGYENVWQNQTLLSSGVVKKGIEFTKSPARKGYGYCPGINLKVVSLPITDATEDAIVISRSAAERMSSTRIQTIEFTIRPNQVPLNLYGEGDEHKFMPDIGEVVGENHILAGFRTPTPESFMTDINPTALREPQAELDTLYCAPAGSEIINIEMVVNPGVYENLRAIKYFYSQAEKYRLSDIEYYKRICEAYEEIRSKYPITPQFGTLITRAYSMLKLYGVGRHRSREKRPVPVIDEKEIELIHIRVTYKTKYQVAPGFKIAGRNGDKGVISAIWEDEDMPVDAFGNRADMITSPETFVNRLNPSQETEKYLSYCCTTIESRIREMLERNHYATAFEYLCDFYSDINPSTGHMIRTEYGNSEMKMKALLDSTAYDPEGIKLHIPPSLKTISMELIKFLEAKYNIPKSCVEFNLRATDGSLIRRVRTTTPAVIGAKYVYLLCKIPKVITVSMCYANQFKVPIHAGTHAKKQLPVRYTPFRLGVDETKHMIMCAHTEPVVRLLGMHSSSYPAAMHLAHRLLHDKNPAKIKKLDVDTETIVNDNSMIDVLRHTFSVVGVDIRNTKTGVAHE